MTGVDAARAPRPGGRRPVAAPVHHPRARPDLLRRACSGAAAGGRAREYLARRGLNDETLRHCSASASRRRATRCCATSKSDGFSEQELQAAGVIGVTDDEGRQYDFFRERVLFPIRDAQGRTIAFGGRSFDDAATPKYLNSRDTLLFHKQETLFAFDLARKPMAQERQVVIVEGYMDAAMAHQHGYRNVVATLGTAVTDRHLRLAAPPGRRDRAGAGRRRRGPGGHLARAAGGRREPAHRARRPWSGRTPPAALRAPIAAVQLRVLALPNAKDPDELIRRDPSAWPTLVRSAMPVIDFVLQRLESAARSEDASGEERPPPKKCSRYWRGSPIRSNRTTTSNEVAARLQRRAGRRSATAAVEARQRAPPVPRRHAAPPPRCTAMPTTTTCSRC